MRRILLLLAPMVLLFLAFGNRYEHKVTGTVTDENGAGIIATVQVKGSKVGTQTDAKGQYSLTVADKNATLVFSAVGYNTASIALKGQATVNVKLTPATQALQEVVVTGYGARRQKSSEWST